MRKQLRKISIIFALTFIFLQGNLAAERVQAASAKNWYQSLMATSKGKYKVGNNYFYRKDFPFRKVIDINGDGVKELILAESPTMGGDSLTKSDVLVFTYHKGKAKLLNWFTGVHGKLLYNKKLKVLCYTSSYFGRSETNNIYQLKDGKLEKVIDLYGDNRSNYYQKDGKECSSAIYQKYYLTYMKPAKDLSFSVNKVKVSNKQYKKLMKKIIPKKWAGGSSLSFTQYYFKFTNKYLMKYNLKTNKIEEKFRIKGIYNVNGEYWLEINKYKTFQLMLENGKVESLWDCFGYIKNDGKWELYGSGSGSLYPK